MKKALLILMSIAALAACTPQQLVTWERLTGDALPRKLEKELLELPNIRVTTPFGYLNTDGTVDPYVAPSGSRCPQHFGAAIQAGWPESDWPRLDYIMYRESRCQPGVYNGVGADNSYGLMQLNMKAHRGWVGPLVGWDFNRLYDPVTNLWIARDLYFQAVDYYGCGWRPWSMGC